MRRPGNLLRQAGILTSAGRYAQTERNKVWALGRQLEMEIHKCSLRTYRHPHFRVWWYPLKSRKSDGKWDFKVVVQRTCDGNTVTEKVLGGLAGEIRHEMSRLRV